MKNYIKRDDKGRFITGSTSWSKINKNKMPRGTEHWGYGNHLSEQAKINISSKIKKNINCIKTQYKTGHKQSNTGRTTFKKGMKPWCYGKRFSKEMYPNMGFRKTRKYQVFPKRDTSIELKIQKFLQNLGIGFFTHYYCSEISHAYQCDIFIPVQKSRYKDIKQPIIIECDGNYWHKYPIGLDRDKIRTIELLEKGFNVLRLWESEIKSMDQNRFVEVLNLNN